MDFHSVAVKDNSCTIRLLAKFEFPARASNKTRFYFYIFAFNFLNTSAMS